MRLCRTILFAGCLLPQSAALAQNSPAIPRIYEDCAAKARAAQAKGDEIVVCAERDARSPYRIPPQREGFDPAGTTASVSRERHSLYEVGDSGLYSCGNVGPGGHTGCGFRQFKQWVEQYGK